MASEPVVSGQTTTGSPTVTVVIATYNRSQVLVHAIRSVLASTLTDLELIVVGDACTDDTAAVVASIGDPRVRFENLARRCGYQSGPHNHAIAIARGRYIAFLNHDDLYLPEHLEACVAEIDASGADLVWVPTAQAVPAEEGDFPFRFVLSGVPPRHAYWPSSFYFASSWVLRRELCARVGPWRKPEETYRVPSQVWLFEAWKSGAALRFLPKVSVSTVPAGRWPVSYARREAPEHEALTAWMAADPRYRERILEQIAIGEAMHRLDDHFNRPWKGVRRLFTRPIQRVLLWLGIHPQAVPTMLRYKRRGAVVRELSRKSEAK